jgi:segregation and condensation protein B
MVMEAQELRAALEAILFVSNEPVKVDDFAESFPDEGKDAIIAQLEEIKRSLDGTSGGFILEQAAGGWRYATRPEHDSVLKKFFSKKGENRLSLAALETLAIVAYRQPITAPEVSDIRGVNSNAVIRTLLDRRMVRVSGRKNVVGSPFLYRTTREFLVHFGLNDIRDLPRLEEFGDLIGENLNEDLVDAINSAADVPHDQSGNVEDATLPFETEAGTDESAESDVERSDDAVDADPASELHNEQESDEAPDASESGAAADEEESQPEVNQLESSGGKQEE